MNNLNLTSSPFVSVIIPIHKDSEEVVKLINALKNQSYPRESFEIIVVNNSSTDNLSNVSNISDIIFINEIHIQSSYAARNRGIDIARGKILCFLDSDCLPDRHWMENGLKTMKSSKAHLVGGNVIFKISKEATAAEYYDSVTNMQAKRNIQKLGVTTTANLFLSREVIEKIGTFPEKLKSGVDIYYTALAVAKGFKLEYCPKAYVRHPARKFKQLMKKAHRVGSGKRKLKEYIDSAPIEKKITIKKLRGRHPFDHLNPVRIWNNVKENGYKINIMKLFQILVVSYCYLFILGLSKKIPEKNQSS